MQDVNYILKTCTSDSDPHTGQNSRLVISEKRYKTHLVLLLPITIERLLKALAQPKVPFCNTCNTNPKMANCTGDGNLTITQGQASTLIPALQEGIAAIFLSVLNIFLSITALLGNPLILVALRRVSCVHPPTKLLFQCLAVTDLCVGIISQPLFARSILKTVIKVKLSLTLYVRGVNEATSFVLCTASILTTTAISVDRLLALLLGLRYRHVVTLRRVRAVIICFWVIGMSLGFMNYFWNFRIAFTLFIIFTILSVVMSAFSYTRIFLKLRHHQAHVQDHAQQRQPNAEGIPMNAARYKKTVSSIAWVQLALVACYAPFVVSVIMIKINGWNGMSARVVWRFAATLTYLNSSLNPILYGWKIGVVRQAVKNTLREFCCHGKLVRSIFCCQNRNLHGAT